MPKSSKKDKENSVEENPAPVVITLSPKKINKEALFDSEFIDNKSIVIPAQKNNTKIIQDVSRGLHFKGQKLDQIYNEKYPNDTWNSSSKDDKKNIFKFLSELLGFDHKADEITAFINCYHQQIAYAPIQAIKIKMPFFSIISNDARELYKTSDGKIGVLAISHVGHLVTADSELYALRCKIKAKWEQGENNVLTLKSIEISGRDRQIVSDLFTEEKKDGVDYVEKLKSLAVLQDKTPKSFYKAWQNLSYTFFRASDTKELDSLVKNFSSNTLSRISKDLLNSSPTEIQLITLFNKTSAWLDKRNNRIFSVSDDIHHAVEHLKIAAEYGLYQSNQAYAPNDSVEESLKNIQKFIENLGVTNSVEIKKIKTILDKALNNPDADLARVFLTIRSIVKDKTNDSLKNWWSKLRVPWLGKEGRDRKVDQFYTNLANTSLAVDSLSEVKDNNSKFYSLALTSELGGNDDKKEDHKLYLATNDNNELVYKAIDREGEFKLTESDEPKDNKGFISRLITAIRSKKLDQITDKDKDTLLQIIGKKSHIHTGIYAIRIPDANDRHNIKNFFEKFSENSTILPIRDFADKMTDIVKPAPTYENTNAEVVSALVGGNNPPLDLKTSVNPDGESDHESDNESEDESDNESRDDEYSEDSETQNTSSSYSP